MATIDTATIEAPRRECDLVMKGGVTSGAVYPRAIQRLARDYRLRNIGGASAGAIAAVVAGACEYRRRAGDGAAFEQLDDVAGEITSPGLILSLFQPSEQTRPAFEIALAAAQQGGRLARVLVAGLTALRRSPGLLAFAVIGCLMWLGFAVATAAGLLGGGDDWLEIAAVVLLAVVSPVVVAGIVAVAAALALARLAGRLERALVANGLGICSGMSASGSAQPALTEWLHVTIQRCAGLALDQPLTFAMLAGSDEAQAINLELNTTDLSLGRPVNLPLPADSDEASTAYFSDHDEMLALFPAEVVAAMVAAGQPTELAKAPGRTLHPLPGPDLPIIVAARLSLSFPGLLSTVPLHSDHPGLAYLVDHTMSDGGITSNFPIHFFDGLFPRRPTFGLDLAPYPDYEQELALAGDPRVLFGDEPRPPAFSSVEGLATFGRQIFNAARNWRDTMQADLPGYRERICQIRLTSKEGGLNLDMPPDIVERLLALGDEAGAKICAAPPEGFDWGCHRFTRYLTTMHALQACLQSSQPGFEAFARDVPEIPVGCRYYPHHEPPWWSQARPLTQDFLDRVCWGRDGVLNFDRDAPVPAPVLRITPDV
jgi:predicted acylesterase/phospholipase RssA